MPVPKRFDWDDARRRHAAGERIPALAREYGVTPGAVRFAVYEDARLASVDRNRRWRTVECETCGGPAMRITGSKKKFVVDGRVLCAYCRAAERCERLAFDHLGELEMVRCASHDCANGERWQPPENFPRGSKSRSVREGGIHTLCRACQTRARRRYREARKVPCSHGCGTMVLHERRDPSKPPECLSCAARRIRLEAVRTSV